MVLPAPRLIDLQEASKVDDLRVQGPRATQAIPWWVGSTAGLGLRAGMAREDTLNEIGGIAVPQQYCRAFRRQARLGHVGATSYGH